MKAKKKPAEAPNSASAQPSDDVIYRTFAFETCADSLDESARSLRMIASTAALDSYGDIVEQYWDLSRYNKNPAVLYGHNRSSGGGFFGGGSLPQAETIPVGYSRKHEVVNGRLEFEPVFSDDRASPLAERVWQGIRQKTLRAASVGFRPGEVVKIEHDGMDPEYHIGSLKKPNVLVEISIVPIPANPEAVSLSAARDTLERIMHRQLLDLEFVQAEGEKQRGAGDESAPAQLTIPGMSAAGQQPPEAAKGHHMDPEKLIQELKDQLTAKAAELGTATERANTAEAELKNEREAHTATKALLQAANNDLDSANTKLETVEAERKKAEEAAIRSEVESYSGVKFYPSELDDEIDLRTRKGADAWKARMDARPALKLDQQVVPNDKTKTNTVASGGRRTASNLISGALKAANEG